MDNDILRNWQTLNDGIDNLTEEQCAALLKKEKAGARRLSFLIRIYGKFNKLRTHRERLELANVGTQK